MSDLKRLPKSELALLFNIVMYSTYIPSTWKLNRTILIPKTKNDLENVDNWRPITISSAFHRLFNKILGKRMAKLPFHRSQRGFLSVDGTFANTMLLQALIKTCRTNLKPHSVTMLDLRKAFDTVPHSSIKRGMKRFNLHPKIIDMVINSYTDCVTTVAVGGRETGPIPITKGVKQGDPISPFLFNMVIDELLCILDTRPAGLHLGEARINNLPYADDLILLTESREDMQFLVRDAKRFLDRRNMQINALKSANLTVKLLPKKKKL